MNEIKITFKTGQGTNITAKLFYDNAGTMTQRGSEVTLEEKPAGSCLYVGNGPVGLSDGDIIVGYLAGAVIGSGVYSNGVVDANITQVDGEATTASRLAEAAKFIVNKTTQNKSTGVITVYDNDDTTPILTLTPTDDGATIIKARS